MNRRLAVHDDKGTMMQSDESSKTQVGERIGPLRVEAQRTGSHGADCFVARAPDQRTANVWRWPSDRLDGLLVPTFASLIETLRDVEAAGVSQIVHGSVATDHAIIAYIRPEGRPLREYLKRGKTSPIEAVTSAISLLDGLAALHTLDLRGAWWTPDSLWAMDDEAQWALAAPGLTSALRLGPESSASDVAFRAPEAAPVGAITEMSDQEYAAAEVYAVGATLYYAMSLRLPFEAETGAEYLAAQQSRVSERVEVQDEQLAPHKALVNAVASCLDPNPSARPQSLEELRRILEGAEREARFQDSRVDFLPARVSETLEMSRPARSGEAETREEEVRSGVFPLLALIALIAIALFLIGR